MAIGDDLLVPTLIVGGIGLFLLGAGLREAYLTVRLWRRRAVPIGDLGDASGTVTVTGRAERIDETRRAPLSGRDCLAYAWRIVGLRTVRGFDGRVEQSYHQLARGQDAVRFRLSDYSGSVVVDPSEATLRLNEAQVTDPVRDPVRRTDVSLAGVSHDGPRQYYEARVDEGETIVVQGRLRPSDDVRLDVEKIGVQLSGRGLYIADSDRSRAIRRSALAAAVSLVLGAAALAVLAVLLGVLP